MLIFAFALGTIALLFQSALFPHFTLLAYAPWIALATLFCPVPKSLWLSAAAGAAIDLLSDDPIGLHALNYAATAALLFRYRKHFLHDNPLHLGLFTLLVSFTSTLLQLFLLFLFDRRVPFAGEWIFVDLVAMPIADAIYALIWFAAPLVLYTKLRRHGSMYWRHLKANLFPT